MAAAARAMRWPRAALALVALLAALSQSPAAAHAAHVAGSSSPHRAGARAAVDGTPHLCPRADFGAAGDGLADDSRALQAALDACLTHEHATGAVTLAHGVYRLDAPVVVPANCALVGGYQYAPAHALSAWTATPSDPTAYPAPSHSAMLAYAGCGRSDGPALISVSGNAALRGVVIYHPMQATHGEPEPYPFAVDLCTETERATQARGFPAAPGRNATPAYT